MRNNNRNITDMNRNKLRFIKFWGIVTILFFISQNNSISQNQSTSQPEIIKGVVIDANTKKPVAAAQISVVQRNISAVTDENGAFQIKNIFANDVIQVSAFDYSSREIPLQGKLSLIVELYPDLFSNTYKQIDGVNGKVNNTSLISSIKGIDLPGFSASVSPDEFLVTELGGNARVIKRSAVSGMGSSVFIRGLNSVNANAQPLYVVDGVIWNNLYDVTSIHDGFFNNPLTNIDITDVESITVMKDGTSVYGSKAANGIILIKTKRGSSMATKINLNIVTGITTTPKTMPVMNADQYRVYVSDILGTAGLTNNEIEQLPYLKDDPLRSTYKLYHNNTNWNDEVYQNGVSTNYSINVNGGDDKALYYFSLGYTGNDGAVKSTDFQRYNMRLNADVNMTKEISVGINIGIASINRKVIDDGVNNYTSPTWLSLIKSPFLSPNNYTSMGDKTSEYTFADIFDVGNPGGVIKYSNNTVKQYRFNVSLKPEIKLSPDFTLTEQFDYNLNKTNEDYYRPYLFTAPIFIQRLGDSYNARMSQVMRNNSIFSDTRLKFVKQLDDLQRINAFIGTRYLYQYFESDYVEGHNSLNNSSINLVGGFSSLLTDGINNISKSISHYASADYSYDNRYFVNAAIAMDGSSRFGKETKSGFSLFNHSWGVFPSVNGAWLISSEKFMNNVKGINLLKLRAGYGITGNDDIEDYKTSAYFTSVRLKGVANGMVLSGLANPEIQWETTSRANAGLDINLLNERIALSFDVFTGVTSNLLILKDYQDVVGLDKYWTNEGSLSNKGFELSLSAKMLNLKNFQWELGVSAGHYKNKIIDLPNGEFTTNVYGGEVLTAVGNSAGVFYGYKTNGVFVHEAAATEAGLKMLNEYGTYSSFGAGDVIFEDKVVDGIIDEKDKQIIGDPNPDFYGTFSNVFNYKKLTLSTLFTYSYGNDIYNFQRNYLESGKDYSNQTTKLLSRWTTDGQVTTQPKAVFGDPMKNARFSDRWIEDGSYIRLKSVSLSYNLPLKSNFIEGIDFWVSANNLFTITNYLGADPEFSAQNSVLYQGVDAGLLPLSKSYYIGLKFNL